MYMVIFRCTSIKTIFQNLYKKYIYCVCKFAVPWKNCQKMRQDKHCQTRTHDKSFQTRTPKQNLSIEDAW